MKCYIGILFPLAQRLQMKRESTLIAGHISAVEHGSRLRLPGDLCEAVRERRQPGGSRNGGQGAQEAERRHQERGDFADLESQYPRVSRIH